jgi:hypothetical protein
MGSIARSEAGQTISRAGKEDSRPPRAHKLRDLDPEQIEAAKQIAAAKSLACQTQLRMCVPEGIGREGKRA